MNAFRKIALAAIVLCSACFWSNAAGTTTKTYDFKGFDELEIGWVFDVEVIKSNKYSVEVEATDEVFKYLEIELRGKRLHLAAGDLPRTLTRTRNWNPIAKATVYMPELSAISMSGASRVRCSDKFSTKGAFKIQSSGASRISGLQIEAGRLDMQCSGAVNFDLTGDFDMADIQMSGAVKGRISVNADDIDIRCSGAHEGEYDVNCNSLSIGSSGATKIKVNGAADNAFIDCSGACDVNLLRCETKAARVELSGASRCHIAPEKKLSVDLSGASNCRYRDSSGLDLDVISVSRGSSISKIRD